MMAIMNYFVLDLYVLVEISRNTLEISRNDAYSVNYFHLFPQ